MNLKPIKYKRVRDLLEKESGGKKVPFSICYACLNGALVDIKEKCMIVIGVDVRHKRHTIKSLTSGEIRTIHDVLILRINDSKVVVS